MKRLFAWAVAVVVFSATAAISSPSPAQSSVLDAVYGQGVHAYNSHQYDRAYELFSNAINSGYEDPRAYYFRGFAADAMGRSYEAEADWQTGAELEARGKVYGDIGRSLSRIQGHRRLELERIRQDAQIQMLMRRESQRQMNAKTPQPRAENPPTTMPRQPVPPAPTPPAIDENPFADDVVGDPTVESENVLEGTLDEDPFAPEPGLADAPAATPDAGDDGNVFGDAAGDDGGGIFGGGQDGGDDIFGGDSPF